MARPTLRVPAAPPAPLAPCKLPLASSSYGALRLDGISRQDDQPAGRNGVGT